MCEKYENMCDTELEMCGRDQSKMRRWQIDTLCVKVRGMDIGGNSVGQKLCRLWNICYSYIHEEYSTQKKHEGRRERVCARNINTCARQSLRCVTMTKAR